MFKPAEIEHQPIEHFFSRMPEWRMSQIMGQGQGFGQFLVQHQAQQSFDRCKLLVKQAGLSGPGQVRVNKAGCLDRCAGGPVAVVYPEGVWYTFVDKSDIDEIVDRHLAKGEIVERLVLPDDVGR